MDAQESLVFKLLFESIEAPGSGQEPSLLVISQILLWSTSAKRISAGSRRTHRSCRRATTRRETGLGSVEPSGASDDGISEGKSPSGESEDPNASKRADNLSTDEDRTYRHRDGSAEEGYEDLGCPAPVEILPGTPHSLADQFPAVLGGVASSGWPAHVRGFQRDFEEDSSFGIGKNDIPDHVHCGKWRRRRQPAVGKGSCQESASMVGALPQCGIGACDGFAEP